MFYGIRYCLEITAFSDTNFRLNWVTISSVNKFFVAAGPVPGRCDVFFSLSFEIDTILTAKDFQRGVKPTDGELFLFPVTCRLKRQDVSRAKSKQ